MRTCPACRSPLPADARFCPACGGAAVAPDPEATMPVASGDPTLTSVGPSVSSRPAISHASLPPAGPDSVAGGRFVPGDLVNQRYRVVGLLGRGGMGEVYRAEDLKLGQQVALKFLPRGLDQDPHRLQLFLNEVRTARQVTHPNVCRVYDIDETGGQHFLSMEYVDGEDLATSLTRIGRLPEERAVPVARQICAGLAAAHEQGILHRDLKPANVMIDGRGRVKLTDFGLAGLAEGFAGQDVAVGTPAYMSPEQITGREVTVRSDIYALGLVLYELFTGRAPFRAETMAEYRELHADSMPSQPTMHVPGLDPVVERAIMRCLAKEPGERPASALAVAAALP
ncbi:protein kinase, partial [bacterium]|nr:protein kinase [bacterium]